MEVGHWEHSYAFAVVLRITEEHSLTEFSKSTTLAQQGYQNAERGNAISHPQCSLCMWYLCCHQYNLCASVFSPLCAARFFPFFILGYISQCMCVSPLLLPADAHIQITPRDRSWTVFGHRRRRLSTHERGGVSCICSTGCRQRSKINPQTRTRTPQLCTTFFDARSNKL